MVDEKAAHLLNVLKDINRDDLIRKLNQIKENNDNHISHLFLEDYFRSRDVHIPSNVYMQEAHSIVNIFPQYSVDYIKSMLETLGSEANRVIIIVRQLLKNEPINYTRKDITNNELRFNEDLGCLDLFLQPSTSTNITPMAGIVVKEFALKRKYEPEPLTTTPKIKIKPIASILNSTSETKTKNDFRAGVSNNLSTVTAANPFDDLPFLSDYEPTTRDDQRMPSRKKFSSFLPSDSGSTEKCHKSNASIMLRPKSVKKDVFVWERTNQRTMSLDNSVYEDALEISSEDEVKSESNSSPSSIEQNEDEPHHLLATACGSSYNGKLVSRMMEMFPDASPTYIKQLCAGKDDSPVHVDSILLAILSNPNYPKRTKREPSPVPDLDLEEQVQILQEILPDADPNYLQFYAGEYLHDKERMKQFMSNALELKDYPTKKESLRKQQISAQVKQYTSEFNVEKFLELIPDPESYFNDKNKKSSLLENDRVDVFCLHYTRGVLKNLYLTIPIKTINSVLAKHSNRLTSAVEQLDEMVLKKIGLMKTKRKHIHLDHSLIQNIPLLQEIAYLSHKTEIRTYLEEKETKEREEFDISKQNGLLRNCNCCYNNEVMAKNIVQCQNNCEFCNNCVKTSAEILFSENKLDFPCLQDCGSFFSLQTLQAVLSPKLFSKMAQKKQLEEVKAAGIEELEMCPFCDFATIPVPEDKLFRCLNSECMKESCRQCKEPSHVPLRCDEIEKDDDVKLRTYIEDKMTEALIRICYKCGMKFIKAEGCNKMTCSCGAMMCYVCGQPVTDYTHFNGQGGDKYHLCPLYSDTEELHKTAVIKGAEKAKVEVGATEDPTKLKIDPTADIHQHYKNKKSKTGHTFLEHGVLIPHRLVQVNHGGEPVLIDMHRHLHRAHTQTMCNRHHHHHH